MDGAVRADERLPWLADAIPAAPAAVPAGAAARRARTPLLVLLGLFLTSAIAVMAFLVGRSVAPDPAPALDAAERRVAPVSRADDAVPLPVPDAAIVPPDAPVTTPADPVAASAPVAPAPPRAAQSTATARPSAERPADAAVKRDDQPTSADAPARRPGAWSERPFAGPPGRVIDVGSYASKAEADAAWWRLARSYPYLGTLPRLVTPTTTPDSPRAYHIRLSTGSRQEARSLCENLHRNRRGCVIDWSQR